MFTVSYNFFTSKSNNKDPNSELKLMHAHRPLQIYLAGSYKRALEISIFKRFFRCHRPRVNRFGGAIDTAESLTLQK
jgi:hypothetical protein